VNNQGTWEVSYTVTPAAKRTAWLRIARNAVLVVVPVAALLFVVFGRISTFTLPVLLGAAIGTFVNGARRGPRGLTLASEGITYRDASFTLVAPWSDVDSFVRLAARSNAVAIRLGGSSVVKEDRFPVGAPWRRQPYPFDRTIPLEPFIDGDPEQAVIARLRDVLPAVFESDLPLERRPQVRTQWRAIGLAAALVPAAIAGAVATVLLGPRAFEAQTLRAIGVVAIIVVGSVTGALWRWNALTGERTMDFIGRALVAPRAGERGADVARALAPTYLVLAVALVLGFGIGRLGAATDAGGLVATYGQAHTCYLNADHKISGCLLNDRTTRGAATNSTVTCYFNEPLPTGTVTYHCDR
jgi:hypothetical protein